ncbi:hypothetical protein C4D43_09700 [Clostridium perfringens]|uniref:hypothetical protein n=1 Tax=Clostridium perfringens TaxID=1502 RepID=UPI000D70B7DD|nr:hypothetical protein [Clostridium perfringens]PWX39018.1 hypothetical protein CYK90_11675 [Clostridium perfringens]PWX56967.1 hypothetical protein CYK89_01570 [Clostridium perfringens]
MDDFLLKILNIMLIFIVLCVVYLIGYLIYLVGYAIYLKSIDYKTTGYIESGIVIDKYEEKTKFPIIIGNTINFNSYRHLYLFVKSSDSTYEVGVYSHKYNIGDEVQLRIKEYKNKVVLFSII